MHKQIQATIERGSGSRPRTKDIIHSDTRIRLYSIGWMRYMTYLADVTLRGWERKQILPKPIFALAGGVRWYSSAELIAYSRIIQQHYTGDRDLVKLKQALAAAYVKIHKSYTVLKKETANPDFLALRDEESYERNFNKSKTKDKLSKEKFYEVEELIRSGNGKTSSSN
jgi:DNA-binding transcriptional MerR regulator